MLKFNLPSNKKGKLKILFLGAHCDDIEIGCGGTILKLKKAGIFDQVKWVVFASNEKRKKEAKNSAKAFLSGIEKKDISILDYKDSFLSKFAFEIKEYFEEIKNFEPDIIFTHYRFDRHQDHKLLSDLTWNTFRNHLILEYEIPKYDGDLGHPNFFVSLESHEADEKSKIIIDCFESQQGKHWFDKELFCSIMRIRAMECASDSIYAEGFYNRKLLI